MDTLLARLETWLRANRPDYLAALLPGRTEQELATLEAALGFPLPDDLKALYRWRGGTPDRRHDRLAFSMAWLNADALLRQWRGMRELQEDGAFDDVREILEIPEAVETNWWNVRWVPFLEDGSGDYLCVDTLGVFGGPPGQVLHFWHECEERQIHASGLRPWLEVLVTALEEDLLGGDEWDVTDKDAFTALRNRLDPGYPREAWAGWSDGTEELRVPPPPRTPRVPSAEEDAEKVRTLLARGGMGALFLAVRWEPLPILEALIAAGCGVNLTDDRLRTALMEAVVRPEVVTLLLAHGADPNAASNSGWAALHLAAAENRAESVRLLLEAGAQVDARDDRQRTPLLRAAAGYEGNIAPEDPPAGRVVIAQSLLNYGADPNARDTRGATPLQWAARSGNTDLVQLLLTHGADPTLADRRGITPAEAARRAGHDALGKLLPEV